MEIKLNDGSTANVTGSGQGLYNTITGTIGAAGALLGGGGVIGGLLGGGNGGQTSGACGAYASGNPNDPNARFITKGEADLMMALQGKDLLLAEKNAELKLKESEQYTDQKLVEVYSEVTRQANQLRGEIETNRRAQEAVNAQQMAYNAAANANIDVLKSQIAALSTITTNVVPQNKVCNTGCGCCSCQG